MNLRQIAILLGKEFQHGSRSFIFIFAIVIPLVLTLVISLVFGALFSEKPKLGIVSESGSRMVALAAEIDSVVSRDYASAAELRQAVAAGAVDMGLLVPPDFDREVISGSKSELTAYVWGESLLKDRAILGAAVAHLIRELAGQEAPVEIVTATVGDGESIPWGDRLLPFVVMASVFMSGAMIPATSLVGEKQKRTLAALTITPASLEDVLLSKGLLGLILSLMTGIFTLILNRAFGAEPSLLILLLALGGALAAGFGVLLGTLTKDINTLFATFKGIGIFLYAPAIVYMFPAIPSWVGKIFPTYYFVGPVVEIALNGGSWPDVALEVVILIGLIGAIMAAVVIAARRMRLQEV
jgi:ABC-2 type transport system permease protein